MRKRNKRFVAMILSLLLLFVAGCEWKPSGGPVEPISSETDETTAVPPPDTEETTEPGTNGPEDTETETSEPDTTDEDTTDTETTAEDTTAEDTTEEVTTEPPVTEPPVTQSPVTQPPVTQPPVTQPPVTQPPVTQPPVTQPPVTQPPVTQPPVTEPPVTQPPVTEPPVTQPPVTQPPVTQPPVTQPPVTEPPVTQPPAPVTPATPIILRPVASGIKTASESGATVDYSNTSDGYFMVRYGEATTKNIKVQVQGPGTTYMYDMHAKEWVTIPLTEGNGTYTINVFLNIQGTSYSKLLTTSFTASIKDSLSPFLRPNQLVNYENASATTSKAAELATGKATTLDKITAIYDFVINNFTYDDALAATVQSGYIPNLDQVLSRRKGICFDYAALITAMLRSQGIPCKMIFGYAGSSYHAWIHVWTKESGWVYNMIWFDGINWKRMDPTYASSSRSSNAIMEYIDNSANYSQVYCY